jgi:hypothetical protein
MYELLEIISLRISSIFESSHLPRAFDPRYLTSVAFIEFLTRSDDCGGISNVLILLHIPILLLMSHSIKLNRVIHRNVPLLLFDLA